MSHTFSELVVKGSFSVVKGFVLGFLSLHAPEARYFFYRKSGVIRHDSLLGLLKEYMELDQAVYLGLEDSVAQDFMYAVQWATEKIGLEVIEQRPIHGASFRFSYEVYNRELAEACRAVFEQVPVDVAIEDYEPEESRDPRAPEYAFKGNVHSYVCRGSGLVRGDFAGVVDLYLACHRCTCAEFISCGPVDLAFEASIPLME